jgi:HEAT repeat protein
MTQQITRRTHTFRLSAIVLAAALVSVTETHAQTGANSALKRIEESPEVMEASIARLAAVGNPADLLKRLIGAPAHVEAAITQLVEVGDTAVGPVTANIRTTNPAQVPLLVQVLARLNTPFATAALLTLISDERGVVRGAAAAGLAASGNACVIPALLPLLSDPTQAIWTFPTPDAPTGRVISVGAAASQAIGTLTGVTPAGTPDAQRTAAEQWLTEHASTLRCPTP